MRRNQRGIGNEDAGALSELKQPRGSYAGVPRSRTVAVQNWPKRRPETGTIWSAGQRLAQLQNCWSLCSSGAGNNELALSPNTLLFYL